MNEPETKATFDLLDAELGDAFDKLQACPDIVRFKTYKREFSVDPKHWNDYKPPAWAFNLNWHEYHYASIKDRKTLDKQISQDAPGIYMFYVRPDVLVNRFPVFVFYVGISGERGSNRPLRERLKDYLPTSIAAIRKRENIHTMLQLYYRNLWVSYALVTSQTDQLEVLEELLHGYLHPCFAARDFPAKVKTQQKAFGTI